MKGKFTVRMALEAVGGEFLGDARELEREIENVVIDSRLCTGGSLFVAIDGENTDGHLYIDSAREKGAVCAITEKRVSADCPCILTKNSVEALQRLAAWYRHTLNVKIVGITGSVGKTTCKEMTASVLGVKYNVHKTVGNFNNEIGLPLTLLSMDEKTQVGVIEMGMSGFGEMSTLSRIASPDMCVITNIGHSHIGILGSQEGIFKAKCEIFEHMAKDAPAFLNGDDKFLRRINRENTTFFGFGEENQIRCEIVSDNGILGTQSVIRLLENKFECKISIPGRHVIYAALAAAGVGHEMGLSLGEIKRGIESAATIGGRVNTLQKNSVVIIDDCYNAAPDSMKAGIDLLAAAGGETVAILGDMGELGDCAPQLHREVGEYAAQKNIGIVAAAGELAKNIAQAASEAGAKALYFETKEELIKNLPQILPAKGTVLVKASHFMRFSEIVDYIQKM